MPESDKGSNNGKRLTDIGASVTIHAHRSTRAGILINGVDMHVDGTRIKLTFEEDRPVDAVFGPQMADAVVSMCAQAPAESGMLSLPDMNVAVDDCQLHGVAVLSRIYAEHVTAITIRIRKLQGNAIRLLRPGLLQDDATAQALERAVDDAIDRIYLPLRNFEHSIDTALKEASDSQAERLHAQIIAFRTEIDNVCYNFERLLSDDLARAKDREQIALGHTDPSNVVEEIPETRKPPHLRIVPGNG